MCHATIACPKPSFREPLRVVNAVVGGGSVGWTTTKSGHPCPYAKTSHKGLLQKRLEKDLCWIVPRVHSATKSVKGLNWTELNWTRQTLPYFLQDFMLLWIASRNTFELGSKTFQKQLKDTILPASVQIVPFWPVSAITHVSRVLGPRRFAWLTCLINSRGKIAQPWKRTMKTEQ